MKTLAILTRRQDAGADDFERLGELEIQAVWRAWLLGSCALCTGWPTVQELRWGWKRFRGRSPRLCRRIAACG